MSLINRSLASQTHRSSLTGRLDRFITTKILRRRYEFVLPGRIKW